MRQRQTPNGYVNETSSLSRQLPSGAYINEVAVPPPATQYQVTGSTEGTATQVSGLFTSVADGSTNATVTVSDGGQGGTFTPSATFPAKDGTFRYTPATSGVKTLTFTNNGGLVDPAPLSFNAAVFVPPASITLVSQSNPVGQDVTFNVSTTNATSVSITLTNLDTGIETTRGFPISSNSNSLVYDGVAPGSYSVTLSATGTGGTSNTIQGNDFTIAGLSGGGAIQLTPPDAPTIGTAVAGNMYVDVAFTAPDNTGSNEILDYTATLSTGETATGTTSPIRVTASNGVARTANVVARSGAGTSFPSAESNSVTPEGTYIASIVLELISDGSQIEAGIQLQCAWFDQALPTNFTAPVWKGLATTQAGTLTIELGGSQLMPGQIGWLIATDSNGNPDTIHKAFSGPVVVQ